MLDGSWLPSGRVELQWPWVFLLLPLPYLVQRFAPVYERPSPSFRVSYYRRLDRLLGPADVQRQQTRSLVRLLGLWSIWVLALMALARPVELGAPITKQTAARDLLVAVDLSGSMSAVDLATPDKPQANRLDVVKDVVGDFVEKRKGDRVGLIVFGDAPFLQVPFTTDMPIVRQLLGETDVAMAGPRTALGDAVGLCLRAFERSEAKERVAIVLSDGNDTGSLVAPLRAARIAAEQNVRLYMVGVGDPRAVGEAGLNEEVLLHMAQLTHGRYLHAVSKAELTQTYAELDALEPIRQSTTTYQPRRSLAFLPLLMVAGLLAMEAVLRTLSTVGLRLTNKAPDSFAAPGASHD
jgi:Ca-activated chloride channel family protein